MISFKGIRLPRWRHNYSSLETRSLLSSQIEVFDRSLKVRQREWSYTARESKYYDYLRAESAARLMDRIEDISRSFPLALELGCHRGHLCELIKANVGLNGTGGIGGIETLVQCDSSPTAIKCAVSKSNNPAVSVPNTPEDAVKPLVTTHALLADEEFLPFKEGQFDIVLSNLNLHWINDLPSTMQQILKSLKPDGAFLGSMLGGNTLQELRYCFYLAEQERRGGISPHTSPFALASDVAALMQSAGFNIPTIDVDNVEVSYPNAFVLMEHLVRMGEGSASLNRQYSVGSDTFLSVAALYQKLYGLEDGSVKATFQIIYMIGWRPDESQPKPCKRGSATKSMKDIGQQLKEK